MIHGRSVLQDTLTNNRQLLLLCLNNFSHVILVDDPLEKKVEPNSSLQVAFL